MKYIKLTILLAIFGLSSVALVNHARADYHAEGIVESVDLLSGISDEAWITGFTATTSVPAGAAVGFLFSVDEENWYNSEGEEGEWQSVASGTVSIDLRQMQWATTTLATSSLSFYYKVRLTSEIAAVTPVVYAVSVEYSDVYDYDPLDNGYAEEGIVLSTDLLSGISDEAWITGFRATTTLAASTSVSFLFSRDLENWYSSQGVLGEWEAAADGANFYNLEALQWATTTLATTSLSFYYKVRLTSDIATHTPTVLEASVVYSDVYDYSAADNGLAHEGIFTSNILADQRAKDVEYFGYNLSSLPANTSAWIMFSNDGTNYYSSTGTAWQWTALESGDHTASSSGFDLTAFGWTIDLYYKIRLISDGSASPVVSEVKAYFTERDPVEFMSIIDPDDGDGTDYTSLSAWEAAVQADLTATTTLVFSYNPDTRAGDMSDAVTVVGETSGATGTLVHLTGTTSPATPQLMVKDISGGFLKGEKVYVEDASSNYVYLTTSGDTVTAVAQCRSTGGTADQSSVTVDGWTTASTTYIKIWTDPDDPYGRHRGKWDENKYHRGNTNTGRIVVNEDFVTVDGLQFHLMSSDGNYVSFWIDAISSDNRIILSNNIIKFSDTHDGGYDPEFYGILLNDLDIKAEIHNNIIYDAIDDTGGYGTGIFLNYYNTAYVYNNTVADSYIGFRKPYAYTAYLANNIAYGNTDNYSGSYSGAYNNLSGPSQSDAPGTSPVNSGAVAFSDYANDDFHLSESDTAARDQGTSSLVSPLYQEGVGGVLYDIDGTARGAAFDIGADEVPVEFVSTICENTSAGGDCAEMDYSRLYDWEAGVNVDLTASTTRVFSGWQTGTIAGGNTVTFIYPNYATTTVTGTVVATTSDQILISGISGTSTPLTAATGSQLWVSAGNYWNIGGTLDELGASPIAIAKIDGEWNASDTVAVDIDEWATDYDNYIKVHTTDLARHNSRWDYTGYRMIQSADYTPCINIREASTRIDGIQCKSVGSGVATQESDQDWHVSVSNSIFNGGSYSMDYVNGVSLGAGTNSAGEFKIWNNLFFDIGVSGNNYAAGIIIRTDPENVKYYFYNNTFHNCVKGVWRNTISQVYVYNNLADSCIDGFYTDWQWTTGGADYNASDLASDAPGTNSRNSQTFAFADADNNDFRLASADTGAMDAGFDITSSSTLNVISDITTDINGSTRPFNGTWDIGADEYAHKVIYRSNGPGSTGALQCGGGTNGMTITSGSISNFQFPISNNIGVGDAIVYNSSSTIAFIDGRTSSTTYSVQNSGGYAATEISNDTTWCIYRAYTSLYNAERGVENTGIPEALRNFDDWTAGGDATTDDVGRDLVANDEEWHIACYGDAVDTGNFNISGWTTGADNYIKIYTPVDTKKVGETQRHSGKWDATKYVLSHTCADNAEENIGIRVAHIRIEGIQFSLTADGNTNARGLDIDYITESGIVYVNDNIFQGEDNNIGTAIDCQPDTLGIYAFNNIIYGDWCDSIVMGCGDNFVYNNTIVGMRNYGIRGSSNNEYTKNNIVVDTQSDDDWFLISSANAGNNISDSEAPLGSGIQGRPVFWDEANKDYHLAPNSPGIDAGTSSVSSIVTHDIDGEPIYTYDIGADNAARYFEPTVMESGGDFSTLASWETAIESDLTATSTLVFNATSSTGVFQAYESSARLLVGQTSGATAQLVHLSTTTSDTLDQFLAVNVHGTFITGEEVSDGQGTTTLLNAGNPAIAVAKIDGEWTAVDNNVFYIAGWNTGRYNYIKIYTADPARHNGKWNDNKYQLNTFSTSVFVDQAYTLIDGLQIFLAGSNDYSSGIRYSASDGLKNEAKHIVSNSIIKSANSSSESIVGISVNGWDKYFNFSAFNNIVYGFNNSGIYIRSAESDIYNVIVNNNTVYDSGEYGIETDRKTILFNNIVQNSGINDYKSNIESDFHASSSNNISSDWTAPGTNSQTTTTVEFLDAANGDFHLSPNDTAARDAGTSSLPTTDYLLLTKYDIDGTARGAAFDIGADEVPVEFVSTICESTTSGGDCAEMDYSRLYDWEAAVDSDLTADTTRVFSGTQTGTINSGDTVTFIYPNFATTTVTATVVATTSDQILLSGITGTTTPLIGVPSSKFQVTSGNEWTISGTGDALGASPIAIAKIDGTWNASDTVDFDIDHWTTDNDNNIKVYTTDIARHNGKWSYSDYRLVPASGEVILVNEKFFHIDGVQIMNIENTQGIRVNSGSESEIKISNNIIRGNLGADNVTQGIYIYEGTGAKIWNNIIYDYVYGASVHSGIYARGTDADPIYIYNNTVYNTRRGYNVDSEIILINNIAQVNDGYGFSGSYHPSSGYNISEDSSAPGANSHTSATVSFVSTSTHDFHLSAGDTAAVDMGVNLRDDPYLKIIDDIDGSARANGFDIGADESPIKIYRSVGPYNTDPLSTGSSTALTISGLTATFSSAQPDNVGVGDAIQYDSDANGSFDALAFIFARESATVYRVTAASGTPPVETAGDYDWQIYRAYTSLSNAEAGTENTGIAPSLRNFDGWTGGADLVANNYIWNIACYGDAVDTTAVTIRDWTTGEYNYLKIFTPVSTDEAGETQRHSGVWDDNKFNIICSNNSCIDVAIAYARIDGIQCYLSSVNGSEQSCILFNDVTGGVEVNWLAGNNILKGSNNHDYHYDCGIASHATNPGTLYAYNNIIYDFKGQEDARSGGLTSYSSDIIAYFYNNTIYNINVGIARYVGSAFSYNNRFFRQFYG